MTSIAPAFPSNLSNFVKILDLHVSRAVQSLSKKLNLEIDFSTTDKEYLAEKLGEVYWQVNRDNRVEGIINDWIREPISNAVQKVGSKPTKGFNIYVTGDRVIVTPKEDKVEVGYKCARMFM